MSLYKQMNILPGVVYDAQAQCEMLFPGSSLQVYDQEKFCDELLCRINGTVCASTGESVVDGTKCGENKWCFQKRCIEAGRRPRAINGGWSDWSAAAVCSRTCGGGVTVSERKCNNPTPANGGRYCLGESRKYWMCNTEPCPFGGPTFRDVQCAEGNAKSGDGPWKAYFNSDEPCVLYCINDKSIVRKIKPRTKDGTRCKRGTKYTCISGVCTKVGCDYVIDSEAVEDVCGICNGDGTECEIEEQYFNDTGQDYLEIAILPAESRNILVEELDKSPNMIALKEKSNNLYILNGDYKESPDVTFGIDKTLAVYRHPEPDREILAIKGPLTTEKSLNICFFRPHNVGYKYRYARMVSDVKKIGMYHWEVLEYEKCSANCEGGIQEPIVGCVEERSGKVSQQFCRHVKKLKAPALKCNTFPCHTRWRVGKWGKCHACPFQSGVRTRYVECVKQSPHPGGEEILVDESQCDSPKPATKELCNAVKASRCRRTTTLGLPNRQLRDVWKQIRNAKRTAKFPEGPDISQIESSLLLALQTDSPSSVNIEFPAGITIIKDEDETTTKIQDSLEENNYKKKIYEACSQIGDSDVANKDVNNENEASTETQDAYEENIEDDSCTEIEDTHEKNLDEISTEEPCTHDDINNYETSTFAQDGLKKINEDDDNDEEQPCEESTSENTDNNTYDDEDEITTVSQNSSKGNLKNSLLKFFHLGSDNEDFFKTEKPVMGVDIPYPTGEYDETYDKIVKVNVGEVVTDQKSGVQVIELPFKETSLIINVSDSAFEELGDVIGDTVMKDEAKTKTGKDAIGEIEKIKNKLNRRIEKP